ncbi:SDR family oxidoreductase [Kutzneria viridogrisea]|uniref:NAD(P)-dependent dehydrogenase (Short-subunit alcohol dehydrogenase family) n=1 Tax=Kutzneria viridogrisea TaxID=47990 RepID=A0ABR6BU31_9PSEU|nr:NAD(P)-dependent dehydrogenase (short-subunit alcohol dehydrogenase family) [Kutzneria viridogrisea]
MYEGRKAVVTGGTHGMGMAMVRALLDSGAQVLLTGHSEANLAAARQSVGDRAHVVRSDVTDLAEVQALGDVVQERFGQVGAVFVNAGHAVLEPVELVSEQSFDRIFAVNAKGAYFTAQRLAPLVRDGGSLVFTTVTDTRAVPGMSVYLGAKAAVRSFAKGFAAELLPRRIRVNSVGPGYIDTPTMGVSGVSAEELAAFAEEGSQVTPLGRIGTAEEVAAAALFLAFQAGFTTGAELTVDGGLASVSAAH